METKYCNETVFDVKTRLRAALLNFAFALLNLVTKFKYVELIFIKYENSPYIYYFYLFQLL